MPPSQAPRELATFDADWIAAEAIVGASPTMSMIRVWIAGPRASENMPAPNSEATARSGVPTVSGNVASTTASATRQPHMVFSGARSDSRPPSTEPAVMPSPTTASSSVTTDGEKPPAWVSIGVT